MERKIRKMPRETNRRPATDACELRGQWCVTHKSWDCLVNDPCALPAPVPFSKDQDAQARAEQIIQELVAQGWETVSTAPTKRPLIYLTGSMRNRDNIISLANEIKQLGYDPFLDWLAPGEQTDDKWQEYARALGQDYLTALDSPHAHDVFDFDRRWLDRCDAAIAVGPFGKSAFAEIGYLAGRGTPCAVLLPDTDPERYDVMLLFASFITKSKEEVVEWLASLNLSK
jgi:nucleoside 2-deoxyribosyltransferase